MKCRASATALPKLVVLLIAGFVSFVMLALLMISKPHGSMQVSLQAYTNESAVIVIKNQTTASFSYFTMLEHKVGGKWPEWDESFVSRTSTTARQSGSLDGGQQTNLTIQVNLPPYPWRISVLYCRALPRIHSVRYRAGVWFWNHHLLYVGRKLVGAGELNWRQLSTPEMAQWQNSNSFGE